MTIKLDLKKLFFFLLSVTVTGIAGVLAAGDLEGLYGTLRKPPYSPPSWVFGVAWAILYLLMAVAAYRISRQSTGEDEKRFVYTLFGVQLLLNVLWMFVFFRMQAYYPAVLVLVALLVISAWMALRFYQVDQSAAYLLVPYLLWLLYAAYLNVSIAALN